ncbi:peptidase M14 [Aurantibacter crassamenti]|nr:peptidase M14 [Aurantibacter crassamenti]
MLNKAEYEAFKVKSVTGRYVINDSILDFLSQLKAPFKVETIGKSVQNRAIKSVEIGTGANRIFMWSQMHGNESTTTRAVLDLLNYFATGAEVVQQLLEKCTIKIIPILSPDGAQAYTRINANAVDLNRDAQDLTQPESIVLHNIFKEFKPHFAFNLHGQRTIFSVGATNIPATVSFLSPSVDATRKLTNTRQTAMQLIVAMNEMLQKFIPNGVGRYDDGFNLNCVGDTFQSLDCPTVLFEAGHYPNDYDREEVRRLIFLSLVTAISTISDASISKFDFEDYFEIPENGKQFFDILIKNSHLINSEFEKNTSVGILFKEVLNARKIEFIPTIEQVGELSTFFGHQTYDCCNEQDFLNLKSQEQIYSLLNNYLR